MKVDQVKKATGIEMPLTDDPEGAAIALLAHDVRSAMFGLLGSLELIESADLPQRTQEALKRANASGALLSDLLNLVFSDSPEMDAVEPLNIQDEVALLSQHWHNPADEADIRFEFEIPDTLPVLECMDRVGFHRVFNNIIGNAIKFSTSGSVLVEIEEQRDHVVFGVCDSGPGFSDEALNVLFEFGGRPEGSLEEGTGLGLYISKSLIDEAGGEISISSNEMGGACVSVTLPTAGPTQAVTPVSGGLPDLGHMNILLAEDNTTNQLVVTQMLKAMGAQYTVASDGVEALELFERELFDLVLLDIEMPRKSGLEVLREIRARTDGKSGVPLVALTAYVMQEHREKISAAGADGLIAKPIEGIASLGNKILDHVQGESDTWKEPAAATAPDQAGYINHDVFETLAKTIGPDFISEFLEKVIIDFQSIRNGLSSALADSDFAKMRSNSHILISVSGAIGATNLQELAQDLNAAARAELVNETRPLNSACIDGILDVVVFLSNQQAG